MKGCQIKNALRKQGLSPIPFLRKRGLSPIRVLFVVAEHPPDLIRGKAALLQEAHLPAAFAVIVRDAAAEFFLAHRAQLAVPVIRQGLETVLDQGLVDTALTQLGMDLLWPRPALKA